jgi:hypothetical protein
MSKNEMVVKSDSFPMVSEFHKQIHLNTLLKRRWEWIIVKYLT